MSKFRTGAAEAAVQKARPSFNRMEYFSLKNEGDSDTVRFLMDANEWVTVDYHSFVPVQKPAPEGREKWPQFTSCVCRKNEMPDKSPMYKDCYICDAPIISPQFNKPIARQTRIFTVGVLRDEAVDENGEPTFVDRLKEVAEVDPESGKPTGSTILAPDIRLFVFAYSNFYAYLDGYLSALREKTLLARDFTITRQGTKKETKYPSVPQDPIVVDGVKYDLRNPAIAAKYGIRVEDGKRYYPEAIDIDPIIDYLSSDEYYGLYFDPSKPQITKDKDGSSVTTTTTDVAEDKMTDLRKKVLSYANASAGAEDGPEKAPWE